MRVRECESACVHECANACESVHVYASQCMCMQNCVGESACVRASLLRECACVSARMRLCARVCMRMCVSVFVPTCVSVCVRKCVSVCL